MTKEDIIALVKEIVAAPSCCAELKAACESYIAAVDTENEKAAAKSLVAELELDVMTVEQVIAAMDIPAVIEHLGVERAAAIKAHAIEKKAKGLIECDCPACAAGWKLLHNKEAIL